MLNSLLAAEKKTSTGYYLDNVTGLRAVAVLWVLIYHAWQVSQGPRVTLQLPAGLKLGLTGLMKMGFLGVDIFFVISGFLLTLPWLMPKPGHSLVGLARDFYARRALRIVPAYYATLLVMVYLSLFGFQKLPGTGNVVAHLLFVNGFWDQPVIRGVFWTLSVEMCFYLVLPLLMQVQPAKAWWGLVVALGLAAIGLRLFLIYRYHPNFNQGDTSQTDPIRYIQTLAGRFDEFAIGMGCAWVYQRGRLPVRWGNRLFLGGVALLLLVVGYYARKNDLMMDVPQQYVWLLTAAAAATGLILAGAVAGGSIPKRLLGARSMLFIGTISYSVYLWHTVILDALQRTDLLPRVEGATRMLHVLLYSVPPIVLLSLLSYGWIERPFLNIRHHVAQRASASFLHRRPLTSLALGGLLIASAALLVNLLAHGSP